MSKSTIIYSHSSDTCTLYCRVCVLLVRVAVHLGVVWGMSYVVLQGPSGGVLCTYLYQVLGGCIHSIMCIAIQTHQASAIVSTTCPLCISMFCIPNVSHVFSVWMYIPRSLMT